MQAHDLRAIVARDPYTSFVWGQKRVLQVSSLVSVVVSRQTYRSRVLKHHRHLCCPERESDLPINIQNGRRSGNNHRTKNGRRTRFNIAHPSVVASGARPVNGDRKGPRGPLPPCARVPRHLVRNLKWFAALRSVLVEERAEPLWPCMLFADAGATAENAHCSWHEEIESGYG